MIVNQTEEGLCAMLFNESVFRRADFCFALYRLKKVDVTTLYDSWFNRAKSFDLKSYPAQAEGYAYQIPGSLEPGELLFVPGINESILKKKDKKLSLIYFVLRNRLPLYIPWKVTTKEGKTLLLKSR